ncbi:lysophospholipid acyltransferase family protein [Nocardioides donggukensis]|uniref:1-acyl-sn-glycerol-3-phosphate acyltransferase n=1 Tax=Nocardioides donggukensis TaxID=2774019 RepID=A0A927Q0S5_9ACTN|nr:lysophospholipid acyltransferase family protein [Nocardioides donggukensis]MBD8870990.1 1-acyl-sn-glycerol-3-phosphate acyltransferase [Nocardioides donggukensis]
MPDITYPIVIAAAKTWFRLGDIDIRMDGTGHIPREGGALLAVNHISYVDYLMAGYPGAEQKRLTRFMAKREVFDNPVGGPVMRSFGHISVDRSAGLASMDVAAEQLRRGELVGIFPEATISRSFLIKELKTGAARIAAKAEVPLIPVVLWGTQRMYTKDHPKDFSRHKTVIVKVGEPLHPTGTDPRADTAELQQRMETLLDQAITAYPAEEQPPGSWWLPATYGGSAPTLEEAEALDAAEKRQRAQRKAAKKR